VGAVLTQRSPLKLKSRLLQKAVEMTLHDGENFLGNPWPAAVNIDDGTEMVMDLGAAIAAQAGASGGCNCKLAVAYAVESVEATRKSSQVAVALTKKLLCRQ